MFEIAPNRFIVASRIVGANIYEKDSKIRVAITMDTVNAEERTCFSAQMASQEEARAFILNMNAQL